MPRLPPDRRVKRTPKQGTTVTSFMRRKVNTIMNMYLARHFITVPVPHTTLITASRKNQDSPTSTQFITKEGKHISSYEGWRKIRAYKNAVLRRMKNLVTDNYYDVLSKNPNSPPPKLVVKYSSNTELGVYAGEDIYKGTLIGYYCGTFNLLKENEEIPTALTGEKYILMLPNGYIDGDPWKFTHGPHSNGYIASLINCAKGQKNNCKFTINKKDHDIEKMQSVKVITIKNIKKGSQLFVDYGDSYFNGKAHLEVSKHVK